MIKPNYKHLLVLLGKRTTLLLMATVLSFSSVLFIFQSEKANAVQLTNRKVTISSSVSALAGVQYDFEFDWSVASAVQSIRFQFCTTPLGTCTLPNAMDVSNDLVTLDAHTGFPTNGTAFAEQATNLGGCSDTGSAATVTMYCINRTQAATGTGTDATVDLGAVLNPTLASGNFITVFVRVTLYSDNAFATPVHDGTVAAAIVRQITTTGRVQERLEFCVAAQTDALWDATKPADCTDTVGADAWPTTTTVDLGVIDNLAVAISPVDNTATNPANDSFGIAMVDTNASNGVAITYFPEVQTTVSAGDTDQLRSFRVVPTDCSAASTSLVDQCFQSAGSAAQAFNIDQVNQELFGLYIACRWHSTGTTGGNLTVPNDYNNVNNDIAEAANCENEDDGSGGSAFEVAFQDTGVPATIATSTSVVDDEILAIRFAALAESTTPTGQYFVTTTYIATPTY